MFSQISREVIFSTCGSIDTIDEISRSICNHLIGYEGTFCLWLEGTLGSGKTTLVNSLFHCLGLPTSIPVTSPTYTYLNDYCINNKWYGHIDCYRISDYSLEDHDMFSYHHYAGFFVEWPTLLQENLLQATHLLTIETEGYPQSIRKYTLYKT